MPSSATGLAALIPGLAFVSEERVAEVRELGDCFALIDPLDGTKEMLGGRSEYTVNLALMSGRQPIAGFIGVPPRGLIYRGIIGRGAERLTIDAAGNATAPTPIAARRRPAGGLTATVSRSHLDPATQALLDRLPIGERVTCGSALKFCRIAEGAADVYPRLGRTFEWDIAAGHAIVAAAGGTVTTVAGTPLSYGRVAAGFAVDNFIAWADPSAAVAAV